MPHYRIESAMSACEKHIAELDPSDIQHKEVEMYIVAGLVTLIVSEYEVYLEKLFIKRAELCGDQVVSNYIKSVISQKFRSPDLGKINETLKKFDSTYNDSFRKEIENSIHHAAWDSVMKARHAIVHKQGQLNLTFRELKEKYLLTKQVLEQVQAVLGVTP